MSERRKPGISGRRTPPIIDIINEQRALDKERRRGRGRAPISAFPQSTPASPLPTSVDEGVRAADDTSVIRGIDGSYRISLGIFRQEDLDDVSSVLQEIADDSTSQLSEMLGSDVVVFPVTEREPDGTKHIVFSIEGTNGRQENPDFSAVSAKLDELTTQQQGENRVGRKRVPRIAPQRGGVYAAYVNDRRMIDIIQEFISPDPARFKGDDFSTRRRRAASRVLEILAYDRELRLQNDESGGLTVLDDEKTFDFYLKRFPDGRVITDEFGLRGIEGVTVPDFLIVKDGRIETVVEVTSTNNLGYFDAKHKAFEIARNSRNHGALYEGANLVFLVPNDFWRQDAQMIEDRFENVGVGFIPQVEMRQVTYFVDRAHQKAQRTGTPPLALFA